MIERVELNNLNHPEPVRQVGQPRENSLQKTDKPFVAELEEKLGDRKKKKEKEKDEIILHGEEEKDEENQTLQNEEDEQNPAPSTDGQKGQKIDLIA